MKLFRKAFPVIALEGLLCGMDSCELLKIGAVWEGLPALSAPVWFPPVVGGLMLEGAMAVWDIFTTLPACGGFLCSLAPLMRNQN